MHGLTPFLWLNVNELKNNPAVLSDEMGHALGNYLPGGIITRPFNAVADTWTSIGTSSKAMAIFTGQYWQMRHWAEKYKGDEQ